MDENELINKIESMIDDEEAWGKPDKSDQRTATPQRQRSVIVSVRFSPAELTRVQSQAERMGLSVSAYLRTVAFVGTENSDPSDDWSTGFVQNQSATLESVTHQPVDVISFGSPVLV